MKTTLSLLALFLVVLIGGYVYSTHQSMSAAQAPYTAAVSSSTATPASTPVSTPASPAAPTSTGSPSSYTLAQVATHNTSKSCYAAISGAVYDLTSWISQHPGGAARILSICGKDGTQAFMGQHGSDPRAQAQLATFKIGTLAS